MTTKYTHFEKLVATPEIGEHERMEVSLNKAGDHFVLNFVNFFTRKNSETGKQEKVPCSPSSATRGYQQRFLEKQSLRTMFPKEKLSVPVVDTSAIILAAWPFQRTFYEGSSLRKVLELRKQVEDQRKAAELVAQYKEDKGYSNGVFTFSEKKPLSTYQKVGLHASVLARNYALFMQQGTGKTAIAIGRICNEAEKAHAAGKHYRAIVVAPKNVRENWKTEIRKFGTCNGTVHVIRGTQMERAKQIVDSLVVREEDSKFTVIIMNYETVDSCKESFLITKAMLSQTEGFDFHKDPLFDLGILDEAHYIKTPGAKRSKACHDLRDICKSRMVLTGTPITNNPFDLYMQFEFLGKGLSGFSSFSAFKNFFGVFESGAMGYDKLVDLQNIPLLKERLSRLSYQITKKEALPDLPDKVYDSYEVEMTAAQRDLYVKIAAEIMAEVEAEEAGGKVKKEFMVNHILTKLLRLAQVTSGHVGISAEIDEITEEVIEPASVAIIPGKNPKIEAIVEILKEKDANEKTIIWASFIQDIKSISTRLTAEGIKHVTYFGETTDLSREEAIRSFNEDRDCKVFLANPAAASTGLNLLGYPPGAGEDYDTNCSHAIYFSQNWSSDKRIQSEDRCHRRGTRSNVQITDLVVPNSIDAEIRRRVEDKREMAEDVSDVRALLASLLTSL